ncbi:zona pellucida sperm-binding protein 4-like [Seriola aureovittata]|uniref:zona pellucida sperm-binding protein 4-like n=1 Tax=Seriola aureovittata TaxID=2871759 RepID=UPI0024BF0E68|nr:zona pellucida sperm-binding protein 4-like [Seriola aureovittata]
MEKRWSATSLVALALLGSFVGTIVEAQGSMWQNAAAPMSKGAPPPQAPKLPRPEPPQVLLPPPPKTPQYNQVPKVQPAPLPKFHPRPEVLPPAQTPKFHPRPEVLPPAQTPKFHPRPEVLPPAQTPKFHPRPEVLPPAQTPKFHPRPEVLLPVPPPTFPKYPQRSHDQSPQEPKIPQPQHPAVPQIRKQPPAQSCEVAQRVRITCGGPDISAAGCEAINCCFDGRHCYFGKTVTVQCTKDAQFIVVVARDATLPHIDLESVSLLGGGQGCTHVDSNSDFAIYQFPVTTCGSVIMEEPGVIIYENRMSSSYEVGIGDHGAVTRDSYYELLFKCRYIGTSVETVVAEVLPLQDPPLPAAALGPIQVHLMLANGQCHTKGCNELDVAYNSFYTDADYPVTKVLRDPVYVEVQLLDKTDPNLVLTLGRCWTTTSSNPHSLPQWDILIDGCPNRDDRYLSSLVPVDQSSGLAYPSHYRRFIFKMFTFLEGRSLVPLKEQVYIHCSTAVCTAALGRSCEPSCFRKRRDVEAVDQRKGEPKVVASVGPVNIVQQPAQSA